MGLVVLGAILAIAAVLVAAFVGLSAELYRRLFAHARDTADVQFMTLASYKGSP